MDDIYIYIYIVAYALEVKTEHHCAGISSSFFRRSDVLLLYLLLLAQSGNHGTLSLRRASTSRSCRYRARPLLREALALANAD